ncbi:MAG: hypothetical protein GY711_13135 [bacterium]|nr:hypothetical protein [bacterium]
MQEVRHYVQRTCAVMNEFPDQDPKEHGVIPLDLVQRYINFWYSSSLDLFGAEVSSNSANFFGAGLKGRAYEEKYEDHDAFEGHYAMDRLVDGNVSKEDVPLRNAMNEVLRDEYVRENEKGIEYWNRVCEKAGIDFRFRLPHRRFRRTVGEFAGTPFSIDGEVMDQAAYEAKIDEWMPTPQDRAYVKSLMVQVTEPGKFAAWLAPPLRGIDSRPIEFEYVKM